MRKSVINLVPEECLAVNSSSGKSKIFCKFILIASADCLHLVFGPITDFPYHATLIERFCDSRAIPAVWARKPDMVEIHDPSVRIRGGGTLEINSPDRSARFSGASRAYGHFSPLELDDLVRSDPFFAGYRVTIAHG
jgi:hypothetical protein